MYSVVYINCVYDEDVRFCFFFQSIQTQQRSPITLHLFPVRRVGCRTKNSHYFRYLQCVIYYYYYNYLHQMYYHALPRTHPKTNKTKSRYIYLSISKNNRNIILRMLYLVLNNKKNVRIKQLLFFQTLFLSSSVTIPGRPLPKTRIKFTSENARYINNYIHIALKYTLCIILIV